MDEKEHKVEKLETSRFTVMKISESVPLVIQEASITMLSQRKVWYSDFKYKLIAAEG